jgi:hypothetical protein
MKKGVIKMLKTGLIFKSAFGDEKVTVSIGKQVIQIFDEDGMPFTTATSTIPSLNGDEFAIKNYAENEGMLTFLVDNNIVNPPHRYVHIGFVSFPICRIYR